jgi:uncharacterized protein involved in tellurium resistance
MRKTGVMKHQSTIIATLVAFFLLLQIGSASAVQVQGEAFSSPFASTLIRSDQDDARDAVRSGQVISMEQALSVVRSQYPGRLLDADFNRQAGVYNIKMLSSGEVVSVAVNAQDGRILNVRKGSR